MNVRRVPRLTIAHRSPPGFAKRWKGDFRASPQDPLLSSMDATSAGRGGLQDVTTAIFPEGKSKESLPLKRVVRRHDKQVRFRLRSLEFYQAILDCPSI